jgi:hypothetical protein
MRHLLALLLALLGTLAACPARPTAPLPVPAADADAAPTPPAPRSASLTIPSPTPASAQPSTAAGPAGPTEPTAIAADPGGPPPEPPTAPEEDDKEDDGCLRDNAALEVKGAFDAARAENFQIVRNKEARTLEETFTFEGFTFRSVVGGCAHDSWQLTIRGPIPRRDREALAQLVARAPLADDFFVRALRTDEKCEQSDNPDEERLFCMDSFVTLYWSEGQALLDYDFAI